MTRIRLSMSQNRNRCSDKKYIRFDHDLLAAIESIKPNNQSFSAWVKSACWDRVSKNVSSKTIENLSENATKLDKTVTDMILELSRNGLFNQQIAETLNQQRITPLKGKRWTRAAINEVLKNIYF
jgi:hypothetical protein